MAAGSCGQTVRCTLCGQGESLNSGPDNHGLPLDRDVEAANEGAACDTDV